MDDVIGEEDPAEKHRVESDGEENRAEDAEDDAEPDGEDVFNHEDAEGQDDEEEGDDVADGGGAEGEAVFLRVDEAAAWAFGLEAKPGAPLAGGAAVGAAQEEAALGDGSAGDVHGNRFLDRMNRMNKMRNLSFKEAKGETRWFAGRDLVENMSWINREPVEGGGFPKRERWRRR